MITNEINECLRGVNGFVGTFPCNKIPVAAFRPAFYVINTARWEHTNETSRVISGKHWVALMLKEGGSCEYFDSYGMAPNQVDIVMFVSTNCTKTFKYNTQMVQDPNSRVCGVYCIDYILARSAGTKLEKYLGSFTSNHKLNDEQAVDRVTCLLSARRRSLRLNLKALID